MAGTFKVKPTNTVLLDALARARAVFDNLTKPLTDAATQLTRRARYRFTTKTDPDGRRWDPWAPSTAAHYKNIEHKGTLMLDTKALRNGTRFIAGRKDLRAVMGSPVGVYHEQPFKPGKKMPRRAFLFTRSGRGLAKGDERIVINELRYEIDKALGN